MNAAPSLVELNTTTTTTTTTSTTTSSNYLFTPSATIDVYYNITNATNGTDGKYSPAFPAYIRTTSMVFCIVIMCLGVIGNVMVPIVIFKTKDMRNSTNIFLVNLSVADLMVLLICTPTVLVEVNSRPETWVLGREMCKAVPFVELTVAHASVLTILAISFERYYAICKPLKAGYICTKARASFICLLAWFVAAIFTSPILSITQYGPEEYYDGTVAFFCFSLVVDAFPCAYFVGTITVFFLFPLVILVCVYALIARSLMTHPTTPRPTAQVPSQSVIKYRKQVIMMLGAVVVAFFVCLLPFRALTLWVIIAPQGPMVQMGVENYYNLLYFSRIMLYINSAVNPILYNVMSSKFRGGFLRLCGARGRARKRVGRPGDIARKSTTSSSTTTHASSQQTTDSFLKGGQRAAQQRCAEDARAGNLARNVYVRAAPPLAAPKGEIYV